SWDRYLADPTVAVVTMTVTEAGYLAGPSGGADLDDATLRHDIEVLRQMSRSSLAIGSVRAGGDARPLTAPGRLLAGLCHRRRLDAGPITLVPCDNLAGNG